ncbi:DUF763 domain-containing protein [Picrophilus oshimae]|uniref:DUF763 domain-containing protein n=1 Tax=Picrophilus torridus (strain ATCC 700027 / DSM 9790 / JCM 10055 / NBRC 100828 / KAW 2/3) TaxID=1122961 RepID=A0A8G2L705_PICTO|nr:DUF763 domain-containing protein [Picrophilus oshimae]SMD30538.1 hypothetical protein SAMN02745355_0426 [Picrophilus oshimae DSM 9789]
MDRTGTSVMPLHYGHPPEYLYKRMVKLSGILSDIIIDNFGTRKLLENLSDPYWFHSFSLAIGFDWNSSGTTTATLGAMKEYLNKKDDIIILGGKGRHIRNIKNEFDEIERSGNVDNKDLYRVMKGSRLSGITDNKLLQDSFDLYIQFIIMDYHGNYTVINQGMNTDLGLARRYHWINPNDFYNGSRSGISGYENKNVLDLSSIESEKNRMDMIDVIHDMPKYDKQRTLDNFNERPELDLNYKIEWKKLKKIYDYNPENFDDFIKIKGLSKSTIRAISYLAEIIYGDKPSYKDPVKFSFCLGGKDGVPKPVNVRDYDISIDFFKDAIEKKPYDALKKISELSFMLSSK